MVFVEQLHLSIFFVEKAEFEMKFDYLADKAGKLVYFQKIDVVIMVDFINSIEIWR